MKKRLWILFVMMLLVVGIVPETLFADTDGKVSSRFKIAADVTSVQSGDQVAITVQLGTAISKIEDITNIQGELYYDADKLTYVSHTLGDAYSTYQAKHSSDKSRFQFSNTSKDGTPFEISKGDVLTVIFKVNANIADNHEKTEIRLRMKASTSKAVTDEANAYESILVSKEHTWDSGKVTTKATFSTNGVKTYTCTKCKATKTGKVYKVSTIELSQEKYAYNGQTKKPTVTVKNSNGSKLTEGKHYTVTYASGRKNVGRYKVTVKLKENYSGSKNAYFTIVPKAPSSAKANLSTGSGGYDDIKFTWSKCTGASGYLVYYKKDSATKWSSAINVTGKTSYTKKNLTDGTKYTFKVIPYYQDADGTKYYEAQQNKTASIYTLKKISTPKLSTSGGKVTVKWTNISGETGYQIFQSTSKTKTSVVTTYKTTSGTSKTLSAAKGKTYYYKVRAYKEVDGKKVYGPWSSVKTYKR